MARGGRSRYKPRDCWICGKRLDTFEECEFLDINKKTDHWVDSADYNGFCKSHNINKILKKNGHSYQLIKVKERKMRRLIINLFLIGLFIEILIYLPHILSYITR
jgi:hypothetical protein